MPDYRKVPYRICEDIMADFILVRRERMDELERTVERLQDLLSAVTSEVGTASLPESERRLTASTAYHRSDLPPEDGPSENGTYTIGRTKDSHSYADIVWKEFPKPEFSLDEAWRTLKPIIETTAKRPRDSFRQSLNNDERFRKISRPDGIWYRRVDMDQLEMEG